MEKHNITDGPATPAPLPEESQEREDLREFLGQKREDKDFSEPPAFALEEGYADVFISN